MIAELEIVNFQSIGHARLKLGQWTSLVGESDIGKSAVVRAIHAALTNWRGDHFIRRDERMCSVEITLDDGTVIRWQKQRGKSGSYSIRGGGDPQTFEKTGGDVPDEVAALLRVAVDVGDAELMPGLQLQHEPPFLFAETPRRRAQMLGEFDGSNRLLRAEGRLRSRQREAQKQATTARADAEQLDQDIDVLAWVEGAEAMTVAATRAVADAEVLDSHIEAMGAFSHQLQTAAKAIEEVERRRGLFDVGDAPAALAEADAVVHRRSAMIHMAGELAAAERDVSAASTYQPSDLTAPMGSLTDGLDRLRGMTAMLAAADGEVRATIGVQQDVAQVGKQRATAERDLEELVGELCPVCGQPLTKEGLSL